MKKSHYVSEWMEKFINELNARNRALISQMIEEMATKAQIDVSTISELLEKHSLDVSSIANEVAAQSAVHFILDDSALEEVSVSAFTNIMDECLRKTFVQTDFVEAFVDNFESATSAQNLASELIEQMDAFAARTEVPNVIEDYMQLLAEQTDISDEIVEDFKRIAGQRYFADNVDKVFNELAAKTDFAALFAERCCLVARNSEVLRSLDQLVMDQLSRTNVPRLDSSVKNELVRSYKNILDKLCRDIETERFRHLPWDRFVDLTYGSLADDPIERPETAAPVTVDELE